MTQKFMAKELITNLVNEWYEDCCCLDSSEEGFGFKDIYKDDLIQRLVNFQNDVTGGSSITVRDCTKSSMSVLFPPFLWPENTK